jgi:hypothetical protein
MAAARERFCKHVPAATDTHTRMNGVVCTGRAEELSGRQLGQPSQFSTGGCEEKGQLEASWKGAAIQRGLERESWRFFTVTSRYQGSWEPLPSTIALRFICILPSSLLLHTFATHGPGILYSTKTRALGVKLITYLWLIFTVNWWIQAGPFVWFVCQFLGINIGYTNSKLLTVEKLFFISSEYASLSTNFTFVCSRL